MQQNPVIPRSIDVELISSIDSFAATGAHLAGDLFSTSATASFRIEGEYQGNINFAAGGVVHIAAGARFLKGSIAADYVFVEGKVEADIHARKCLEVVPTAEVTGNISYAEDLDLHKNVRIRGRLDFAPNSQSAVEAVQVHDTAANDQAADPVDSAHEPRAANG